MSRAARSKPPTDHASKSEPQEALYDIAHDVFMAITRGGAIAEMIAIALYHSKDSCDVDAARLACQGIAVLLDAAADRAEKLHAELESR